MNSDENILTSADAVLKAIDIRKKFKSPDGCEIEVLRGVNLEVLRGQSVSLRGESGAGKTTFLNILAGLETPTTGEIYWDNVRIDNLSNSKQAKLRGGFMGFVFQNYCLVPELNALENVCLASRILGTSNATLKDRAVELLEKVLQEEALAPDTVYPESLQEMIDEYEENQAIKEKLEDEIY